jgi:hypothetical protein
VQHIMNDCWKAHVTPTGKARRAGRKFYNPWRSLEPLRKPPSVKARRAAR